MPEHSVRRCRASGLGPPGVEIGTDHHDRVLGMVRVEPQHDRIVERFSAGPVLDDRGRLVLGRVEHVAGWVRGADTLFEHVVAHAPWEHRTVRMYDRMVEEPRLTAWYGQTLGDPRVPAIFTEMAAALRVRYGRAFDGVGAALYRDGRDSVAWHGDRIDPALVEPVVAIISLGSARTLRLRPRMRSREHRGRSRAFPLLPGDLFV